MNKTLLEILEKDEPALLEELVAAGKVDIKQEDKEGNNLLLYAAMLGKINIVEFLLKKDYHFMNKKNKNGYTALILAARNGHTSLVVYLLENQKVDLEDTCNKGLNVLSIAALAGHYDTVVCLLKQGAYIDMPLRDTRIKKARTLFELLTTAGPTKDNRTPLQLMSKSPHCDTIGVLLSNAEFLINFAKKFSSCNAQNKQAGLDLCESLPLNARLFRCGNTALHFAILHNHMDLVKHLLENGANPNLPNRNGKSPSMLFKERYKLDINKLVSSVTTGVFASKNSIDLTSNPKSKSQLLFLSAALTKKGIGDFLDDDSLWAISKTCRQYRDLFKSSRKARKKATELLHCVLNIDTFRKKRIIELLSEPQPGTLSIVLMRVFGREVYWGYKKPSDSYGILSSFKIKKICKREWTASPLEAAAKMGDNFLVKMFLDKLSQKQKLEALHQLQNIRAQRKIVWEPASYLRGFLELREAYKTFLESFAVIQATNQRWHLIGELWGEIGEAQKNLPNYGLQVLSTPVFPIQDFTKEPKRELEMARFHGIGGEGVLDDCNNRIFSALCNISSQNIIIIGLYGYPLERVILNECRTDAGAIEKLCEVIPLELDKMIESLKKGVDEERNRSSLR